jgi:hypothetical protein
MAVSKRTRFEVFKRDRFVCQYCGRTPPTVILHCDHVIPQSGGGPDEIDNLVTSCEDCNLGKSNVPLSEVPTSVQEKMERTREKREQVEALNELLKEERAIEDQQIEELGLYYFRLISPKAELVFVNERERSIRTFLRRLPCMEIIEAMDIAASRKDASLKDDWIRFKYFCGICWSKIRQAEGDR